MVCIQFDAQAQPGVGHLLEHTAMQALTSQLRQPVPARKQPRALNKQCGQKVNERRRDMDVSRNKISGLEKWYAPLEARINLSEAGNPVS
jgi:hypothetical protein